MKRTLNTVAIAQGGAGTTELVAASGGSTIHVTSYVVVLSALGTFKFVSGGTDKSGAMDFALNGGASLVGAEDSPILIGTPGGNLSITTTVGAAKGHLTYFRA